MSDFTYTPPTTALGQEIALGELLNLILSAPPGYWLRDSYTAGVDRDQDPLQPFLDLTFSATDGFCVQWGQREPDPTDLWVLLGSDNFSDYTTVEPGAVEWEIPLAFVAPRPMAARAVEHFCRTGERHPELRWARMAEIDY